MRFLAILVSALGAMVAAQSSTAGHSNPFTSPTLGTVFKAGTTVTLTWTPTTQGTVSLVLRSGNANALSPGTTIASNYPNSGSFSWSIPSTTVDGGYYTVEIIDDQDTSKTNYTPYFTITSTVLVSVASGSTSGTMSSTATMSGSMSGSMSHAATTSGMMSGSSAMTGSATGMKTTAKPSGTNMSSMSGKLMPSSVSVSHNAKSSNAAAMRGHVEGAMAALAAVGAGVAYVL